MFPIHEPHRIISQEILSSPYLSLSVFDAHNPVTLSNWNKWVQEDPELICEVLSSGLAQELPLYITSRIGSDGVLNLYLKIRNLDFDVIGRMERMVRFNDHEVDHASAEIEETYAGRGLGSLLIRNLFALYLRWEIRSVYLAAGGTVGGYVWAVMGWQPMKECWGSLKRDIRRRYEEHAEQMLPPERATIERVLGSDDPRTVWRLTDLDRVIVSSAGWPLTIGKVLLLGLCWEGFINLGDEFEDQSGMNRLRYYLTDKGLL
jgi:hypothetical protein